MKTKLTFSALFVMLFLVAGITQSFAMQARDNGDDVGHPNFTWIDDFEEGVALWWVPGGAGQSTGFILEDEYGNLLTYRDHETEIVNPHTGSTGSMKLAVVWDTEVEWFEPTAAGSQSHYIRLHMPDANVPAKQFQPGQALEIFVYGDGSNNRFRLMVRDGLNQLEGTEWFHIDWTGWKRFTWDYNDAANVFGWVNGNGVMDPGAPFFFDGIHITRNEAGTTTEGLFFFDDLRIVDPFIASFNITNGDGSEVISINNVTYAAGQTEFELFPGEYEFFVQRDGYESYYGSFEIDDEDVAIDVTLTPGEDQEYDVTFTIMDTEGDLIPNAVIKINDVTYDPGEYTFSFVPGFYNYNVTTDAHFDVDGSFVVVNANVFINVVMEVIPDLNDQILLSWDVASTANMEQYREEYYSVWAGLAGGDPTEDFWMIYEETLDPDIPNYEYQPRSLDISNLNQENIQIAFRHHNVTDMEGIVIDNVKIEGINIGGSPDVLLFEDFEGGVPDGFDPADPVDYDEAWLPEGWVAIDDNEDEFNWHFAIKVLEDKSYLAHMRSLSYDSIAGDALEPDNWLVTPAVQLPLVLFYTATFNITDEAGNPVENAIITLNGTSYNPGQYQFTLINGQYNYAISKEDYISVDGTFTISGQGITIDVTLSTTPLYSVTFNVNMNQADGFVPGETEVYMTGDFPAWDMAPPGTYDEQQLEQTENVFIFTHTLELPAGEYQYKYYDGPSFDNAEWHDDVFRTINVTDDMTVDDVFGVYDPVSVPEYETKEITIFPNPANSYFNVTSESIINELSIYDLSGQLIFNKKIGNNTASIDLGSFNTGLYIIRIHTDNDHQIKKLQIGR